MNQRKTKGVAFFRLGICILVKNLKLCSLIGKHILMIILFLQTFMVARILLNKHWFGTVIAIKHFAFSWNLEGEKQYRPVKEDNVIFGKPDDINNDRAYESYYATQR